MPSVAQSDSTAGSFLPDTHSSGRHHFTVHHNRGRQRGQVMLMSNRIQDWVERREGYGRSNRPHEK